MKKLFVILGFTALFFIIDADIKVSAFDASFHVIWTGQSFFESKQQTADSSSLFYKEWSPVDSIEEIKIVFHKPDKIEFFDTIERVPNDAVKRFVESNKESFINSWQYGVLPSVKMAQAIIESASGTSEVCLETNNYFGIKCFTCDSTYTKYQWRYFEDKESCFSYLNRLYNRMDRYKHLIGEKCPIVWSEQLLDCFYAGDPNYPNGLLYNIMLYDLYELDEIAFNRFSNT